METEYHIPDLQEIRNILNKRIGHFPDKLAKWLFKKTEILRGLVLMLKSDLDEHLDFERTEIESGEVVNNTLRELISDMVFTVPFRDASKGDELKICILLEHQSTVDTLMGYRLLSYMCHQWHEQLVRLENANVPRSEQRLRPILPIIYYTGSRRWETPLSLNAVMDVPEQIASFVPTYDTLFLGVKELHTEELIQTDHPFAWLMTVQQVEDADETSMQQALETSLKQLEILEKENPTLHRDAMIFLYLLVMGRRHKTEQPHLMRLIQTHTQDKEVEHIIMTGAEALIQQGKAEGLEQGKVEGIEEGRINEKRTVVLKLLRHRFDDVSESVVNEITEIEDLVHLDDLFDQLLAAETFDDIDFSNNTNGK